MTTKEEEEVGQGLHKHDVTHWPACTQARAEGHRFYAHASCYWRPPSANQRRCCWRPWAAWRWRRGKGRENRCWRRERCVKRAVPCWYNGRPPWQATLWPPGETSAKSADHLGREHYANFTGNESTTAPERVKQEEFCLGDSSITKRVKEISKQYEITEFPGTVV